jgi:hypothetical protein
MPEKPWGEMSIDDKLGSLRADIQRLMDIGNANNAMLDARNNTNHSASCCGRGESE